MKESNKPIWKKSMLKSLNLYDILSFLDEIGDNGDPYGYERESSWYKDEDGYYQEYVELFEEMSDGAYRLAQALRDSQMEDYWDSMTVAILGDTHRVLGFDNVQEDYFKMINDFEEELAVSEAVKRIERLTKPEMIKCYKKVMTSLVLFFDLKAAHDSLVSIVEELDAKAAFMDRKDGAPQRAFVE